MSQELIQISARKPVVKVFLILLIIVATAWSYFVVRWYLGNTLAEYFNAAGDNLDLARTVVSLAPNDPLTHWRLGQVAHKQLPFDQEVLVIAEFEKAVSLSPNDYRYWMALGVAQEQGGDAARGELALRRAVALAPAYAYPHWYLGNVLVRSGRYDEAFAELRIASDSNTDLRPQLFGLIWEVYGSDLEGLKKAVGENPDARSQFALHLAGHKKVDEGIAVWNSLSDQEKKGKRENAEALAKLLINEYRFQDALNIINSFNAKEVYRAEVGRIFDGGFEADVTYGSSTFFGWQVQGASQVQIGIDPAKAHSGNRSLRLAFSVGTRLENIGASQLIAVAPDTEYELGYYVGTEKLQSGSTPRVQIVDPINGSAMATSETAKTGDHDWEPVSLTFKTGPKAQAVTLRIVRDQCGEDAVICPIFGAVWYDDFSFKARN